MCVTDGGPHTFQIMSGNAEWDWTIQVSSCLKLSEMKARESLEKGHDNIGTSEYLSKKCEKPASIVTVANNVNIIIIITVTNAYELLLFVRYCFKHFYITQTYLKLKTTLLISFLPTPPQR